jgi:threonine/homoserine/homoserine lactone efflux protein
MLDQSVIAFTIAAFVLTITPGNDTILVLKNSISGDRASGFATMFGVCSGLIVHGTFAALGISVILMKSATAFQIVKFVGAGYLIFLGLQSLRTAWKSRKEAVLDAMNSSSKAKGVARSFGQGVLTNVLNPKVALFYLSFLPQFVRSTDPHIKPLLLACIHIGLGIIWLSIIILMINKLRKVLVNPKVKAATEAVCGTMLAGLGIKLALQK